MKPENLFALNKNRFWLWAFIWFLLLELALRIKLGVIFWLCFGWLVVLNWQAKVVGEKPFGKNGFDIVLKSLFYAFLVAGLIFVFFWLVNVLVRVVSPEITYFQLP